MTRPGAAPALLVGLALSCAAVAPGGEAGPDARAQREKAAALRVRAMETARKAFVKVIFTPRWDRDCALEAELGETGYDFNNHWTDQDGDELLARLRHLLDMHRNRETSAVPGLLVGPGLAVIADDGTGYEWRLVGKVEVEDASGRRWTAAPHALMADASAILLKCAGGEGTSPPEYRKDFKLSLAEGAFGVSLTSDYTDPERWRLLCAGAYAPFGKEPVTAEKLEFPGTGSLM
ncbi:MAG: hypothetical protein ACYTGB_13705, partial [Planctomycetota bacterium]